jgi:hypothetical protein
MDDRRREIDAELDAPKQRVHALAQKLRSSLHGSYQCTQYDVYIGRTSTYGGRYYRWVATGCDDFYKLVRARWDLDDQGAPKQFSFDRNWPFAEDYFSGYYEAFSGMPETIADLKIAAFSYFEKREFNPELAAIGLSNLCTNMLVVGGFITVDSPRKRFELKVRDPLQFKNAFLYSDICVSPVTNESTT